MIRPTVMSGRVLADSSTNTFTCYSKMNENLTYNTSAVLAVMDQHGVADQLAREDIHLCIAQIELLDRKLVVENKFIPSKLTWNTLFCIRNKYNVFNFFANLERWLNLVRHCMFNAILSIRCAMDDVGWRWHAGHKDDLVRYRILQCNINI